MGSDKSLRGCSTSKGKKIQADDEERSKKRKHKKNKKRKNRYILNNLSDLRFGWFSSRTKNKTQSYVDVSHQQWNQVVQHPRAVKKGDMVNLSELLFNKHRDFLITYKHRDHLVQATLKIKLLCYILCHSFLGPSIICALKQQSCWIYTMLCTLQVVSKLFSLELRSIRPTPPPAL